MTNHDVAVLGTGMTDMSRRDLSPETMAYQVVHEALGDAGLSSHDLGLVIVGNAMAHRLSDQGCVRGQTWLRKAGLSEAAIVNVDNSCAGGKLGPAPGHHGRRQLGPARACARRREDVDRRPGPDDGRHRGRPAGGVPLRPARAAPGRRQPGRQHPHGPQQRLGPAPHEGRRAHRPPDRRRRRQGVPPCLAQPAGPVPALGDHRRGAGVSPGGRRADPAHVQLLHRRSGGRRARRVHRSRPPARRLVSSARWHVPGMACSTTTTA